MKKRLLQLFACLTLCALLAGGLSVSASAAFQDVPAGHWAADSIQRCVDEGYFNGQTADRFGLGGKMTRSAFVVVLCRFFDWETPAPTTALYKDVPVDAWYAGAVQTAWQHGVITDPRTAFRPADPITREELAVMLVRAMGYGKVAGLFQDLALPFTDVTANRGYLTVAYDLGLVNGTSATTFSPKTTASREQVAVILMRLHDKLYGSKPETAAIVSAQTDLTGLDVAAIPAMKTYDWGLSPTMSEDQTEVLRAAARQAGAKALLHVSGGPDALNADAAARSAALAQAVLSGGYDGLFLDLQGLQVSHRAALTQLVTSLDGALAGKLLYVGAETPVFASACDFAAVSTLADRVVVRVTPQTRTAGALPSVPLDPLEDVYRAMNALRNQVDIKKLSLMISTAPSAWNARGKTTFSAEMLPLLRSSGDTLSYYSERYACPYLTGSADPNLIVWYADRQFVETRFLLAQGFGLSQVCLSDLSPATAELLAALN